MIHIQETDFAKSMNLLKLLTTTHTMANNSSMYSLTMALTLLDCYSGIIVAFTSKDEIENYQKILISIFLSKCLNPRLTFSIRCFDNFRFNSSANDVRGMLILVRRTIQFFLLQIYNSTFSHLKILAIRIKLKESELGIINAYRHPNYPFPKCIINSFRIFLSQFNSVLLMGDFNAHHPLWDSLNSVGSNLYDLTDFLNLSYLNPDSISFFSTS